MNNAAQVGRNPKGEDLQGLRAEHEHAVAEGHAPPNSDPADSHSHRDNNASGKGIE